MATETRDTFSNFISVLAVGSLPSKDRAPMRPKPRHRPIRHPPSAIPRRPRRIPIRKHIGHAGRLAFVYLDEPAHGAVFRRAAKLLGNGAGQQSVGLGKQAVHAEAAAVLQHHIGHAIYARNQRGLYLRAAAGDAGQLFLCRRVGSVQVVGGTAPALGQAGHERQLVAHAGG